VTGIADTGFIVAFLNRRDAHHAWAVQLASEIEDPLVTGDVPESVKSDGW
jgi:predicted nucleic acid-binding protein